MILDNHDLLTFISADILLAKAISYFSFFVLLLEIIYVTVLFPWKNFSGIFLFFLKLLKQKYFGHDLRL